MVRHNCLGLKDNCTQAAYSVLDEIVQEVILKYSSALMYGRRDHLVWHLFYRLMANYIRIPA